MKKLLLISSIVVSISSPLFADTLAQWTFETAPITGTYTPGANTSTTNFFADSGLQAGTAVATGLHAAAAAAYSSPAGNASTHAFSVNNWTVGDYWQLQLSTVGHSGLSISFDQAGSATGPKDFTLSYSLTGAGSFTSIGSYTVALNTWNTTAMSGFTQTFDLGSFTDINNASTVFFRLTDADTTSVNNSTVLTGGTDRIDNVLVYETPIPEPSTVALSIMGGLAGVIWFRRRK